MNRLLIGVIVSSVLILTKAVHVTVVTVILGQNLLYGYYATGPVFDVAFQLVQKQFPEMFKNITWRTIHKPLTPAQSGCVQTGDMMHSVAAEIFRLLESSEGFPVVIDTGCSLDMFALGDFARERDVPILASISADPLLTNKQRYPTILSFGAAGQGFTATGIRGLLLKFSWRTVTFLTDDLSLLNSPASLLNLVSRTIRTVLTAAKILLYYEVFDSGFNPDYTRMLLRAKSNCRIILVATNGDVFRTIMVIAHGLNMTNSDHVFLYAKGLEMPQNTDFNWEQNDQFDQVAYEAYKSVIVLYALTPDWTKLQEYTEAVTEMARTKYNYTYNPGDLNECAVATYETFLSMAKVLNETWDSIPQLTGKSFSNLFVGRTFDLGFAKVVLGPNGFRIVDTIIAKFNATSGKFQDTWYFSWRTNVIREASATLANDWRGRSSPPLDKPLCGYRGELCSAASLALPIGLAVCTALVVVLVFMFFVNWKYHQLQSKNTLWWLLDGNGLKCLSGPENDLAIYGGLPVWMQSDNIGFDDAFIFGNRTLRNVLAEIRELHHDNIGSFVGVVLHAFEFDLSLLWEVGRCSLRALLDQDKLQLDDLFRKSLMSDLLNGAQYIHRSRLKFHGSLSSFSVMVDSRFALKICGQGWSQIVSVMHRTPIPVGAEAYALWMAPEQIAKPLHKGSLSADVYSLAIVMCEILTGLTPFGGCITEPASVKQCLAELQNSSVPRFNLSLVTQPEVSDVLSRCLSVDETRRPHMNVVMKKLFQFKTRMNIVQRIFERLQTYSEDLEDMVMSRTSELLQETQKVDDLLKQMIPSLFVVKLRNKESIAAEMFDCVSVMFADIPKFGIICENVVPEVVVNLLNQLYVGFDLVLEMFIEAYKVETIKDSYMVASGLPIRNGNRHSSCVANLAIILMKTCQTLTFPLDTRLLDMIALRIGIHSGACAAGVVGTRMPRYCLFGDTINTASRIESHGLPNKIHISSSTKKLLDDIDGFYLESRGLIYIKSKGSLETFWLIGCN